MTFEEYTGRWSGLSLTEVRRLSREDAEFRSATEALYEEWYGRRLNKGCSDCWVDAYVCLKHLTKSQIMEKSEAKFKLLNGALLRDIKGGDSKKTCSAANLTDELALYHLSNNPNYIKKFASYPENWEKLVKDWKAAQKKAETPAETPAKGE